MRINLVLLFLLILILHSCSEEASPAPEKGIKEQINLILNSEEITEIEKTDFLNRILGTIDNDSVKSRSYLKISYHFLKEGDSTNFRKFNKEAIRLSLQLQDFCSTAAAFWDLGEHYYGNSVLDSSYHFFARSHEIYELTGKKDYSARMLLNMALVQNDLRDYSGSEVTTIEAINRLKPLKKYKQLYTAYNNLGIIFKELGEFNRSIKYYEIAYSYLSKAAREDLFPLILNNLGVVYQEQGNYTEAKKQFLKALDLEKDFSKPDKLLHAKLLDNLAYTKFLSGDTTKVLQTMKQSLNIRKALNAPSDIIINQLHIAEYLLSEKADTTGAIRFAYRANSLSRETDNRRDLLASLILLSNLVQDSASSYATEYIALRDHLETEERATRNKFARIRFETDEFKAENQKLYSQRNVLVGLSLGIALLGFSGFIIVNQQTKNRELSLREEQQKAGEKIFQLLLDQQYIKEEGRDRERQRLSEELHDGILAKFFGLRLSLASLNSGVDKATILQREKYLEDLKKLEKEIGQVSHELNAPWFNSSSAYLSILEGVLSQNKTFFSYDLYVDPEIQWDHITGSFKLNFLRILQEAVKNIQTHSRASFVEVAFQLRESELTYSIMDNGIGFNTQKKNKGIGLKNMASRTKSMKGKFKIKSEINQETVITIQVPV